MNAHQPKLSVVIPAWNTRDLVLQCLTWLRARSGSVSVEVVLVDNGSTDDTIEAVRREFPATVIVANAHNVGFARANNQGVAASRGEYLLFLNSDTIVGEGTLERCVAELDRRPAIGMVTCRLMYPDGTVQMEAGRRHFRLRHLLAESLYLHMLFPRSRVFAHHLMGDWDHRGNRDVESILGAFMLVRRSVVEQVGGFPEDVFMFHEDLSFCLRIDRAGHRIRYLGDVETVHLANRTSRKNPLRWYLMEGECKVELIREAQGAAAAVAARAIFFVRSVVRLLAALVAAALPGLGGAKQRHPAAFSVSQHFLHALWAVAPWAVRPLMPAAGKRPRPTRARAAAA